MQLSSAFVGPSALKSGLSSWIDGESLMLPAILFFNVVMTEAAFSFLLCKPREFAPSLKLVLSEVIVMYCDSGTEIKSEDFYLFLTSY